MRKKQQSWSSQEDLLLVQFYQQASCFQRWKFISKKFTQKGISKTQFQCRDRFYNSVNPSLRKQPLSNDQIAYLFALYDNYGPCWSYFETKIIGRSQTLLKNKFYTVIRTVIRHFFKVFRRINPNIGKIKLSDISTKTITQLYEGRKDFSSAKNIIRQCMKNVKYNFKNKVLQKYINKNLDSEAINNLIEIIVRNINISKESPFSNTKRSCQQIHIKSQQFNKAENNDGRQQKDLQYSPNQDIRQQLQAKQFNLLNKDNQQNLEKLVYIQIFPLENFWNFFSINQIYSICFFYD